MIMPVVLAVFLKRGILYCPLGTPADPARMWRELFENRGYAMKKITSLAGIDWNRYAGGQLAIKHPESRRHVRAGIRSVSFEIANGETCVYSLSVWYAWMALNYGRWDRMEGPWDEILPLEKSEYIYRPEQLGKAWVDTNDCLYMKYRYMGSEDIKYMFLPSDYKSNMGWPQRLWTGDVYPRKRGNIMYRGLAYKGMRNWDY